LHATNECVEVCVINTRDRPVYHSRNGIQHHSEKKKKEKKKCVNMHACGFGMCE
jgi:hypothetical protein